MMEDKILCSWFGKEIELTRTEYSLLDQLVKRPRVVYSRNQLLDVCYGDDYNVTDRNIDSHIKRLRKKFRKSNQTTQIYHYSNKGYCSWFGFAKQILKIAKIECNVIPVLTKEYPTPAKRPKSTLMNKDKI